MPKADWAKHGLIKTTTTEPIPKTGKDKGGVSKPPKEDKKAGSDGKKVVPGKEN